MIRTITISFFAMLTMEIVAAASLLSGGFMGRLFEQIDRNANVFFKDQLNYWLIKSDGYKFGDSIHTISYVIGKNEKSGTLSLMGKILATILNWIQPYHARLEVLHEDHRFNNSYKPFYFE